MKEGTGAFEAGYGEGSVEGSLAENSDAPSTSAGSRPGRGRPFEFQGGEPRNSYVSRMMDVDRKTWDHFLRMSKGRRNSGMFTAFLQPRDEAEGVFCDLPKQHRHHSIFGLRVLSPYSHKAGMWSLFIYLLDLTYVAFLLPIITAFVYDDDGNDLESWAVIIEIIAGLLLLIDFVMNFHIGFIIVHDYKKKVIMNGKSIGWYYWNYGGALIDALGVLPLFPEIIFGALGGVRRQVLLIFRILRFGRLLRLLRRMYSGAFTGSSSDPILNRIRRKVNASGLYLVNVVYTGAVLTNFMACVMYLMALIEGLDGSWISKGGSMVCEPGDEDCVTESYVEESSKPRQYLASVYWAITTMTTVGYGDNTPRTAAEEGIVSMLMVINIMLFGLLISSISEMMKSATKNARNAETFRTKIDSVTSWLKQRGVPHRMQKKIFAYYAEVWIRQKEDKEAELIEDLPTTVRAEILHHIAKDLLGDLSVFREMDEDAHRRICGHLKPVSIAPGHELFCQGDSADSLFILEEGVMVILVNDEEVGRLEGPATCGEAAVLGKEVPKYSVRPVTLRARKSCHLWEVEIKSLELLFEAYPHLKNDLMEGFRQRVIQGLEHSAHSGKFKALRAELGVGDIEGAHSLKKELKRSQTHDGSFMKVLNETFKKSMTVQKQLAYAPLPEAAPTVDGADAGKDDASGNASVESLAEKTLKDIRLHLQQQGVHSMVAFVQKLDQVSLGGEPRLSLASLQTSLETFGVSPRAAMALFVHFDKADSGAVPLLELADGITAPRATPERRAMVEAVFGALDAEGRGHVELMRLVAAFAPENHPDVVLHRKTKGQLLSELLAAFDGQETVFLSEFWAYHRMVSLCVDDDKAFLAILNGVWNVRV
eukprot:evm.model.scf_1447.2 EVM.evm.TU.scf_1447.2   scf_1447:6160-16978(+)